MDLLHSIILGIVQGLTEFLPVSSFAHLSLLENFFKIEGKLQVTFLIHSGSVLALILAMWKDIKDILLKEHKVIWLLIICSIPAGLIRIGFEKPIEYLFGSPRLIGMSLIITGLILWFTFRVKERNKETGRLRRMPKINFLNALIIGIVQGIAILLGISRTGSMISAGIYLGNTGSPENRVKSAKFSLLLSIISICGATLMEAIILPKNRVKISLTPLIVSFIVSFIISYFAIKLLLKVVKTRKFAYFAFYCWALGLAVILFST